VTSLFAAALALAGTTHFLNQLPGPSASMAGASPIARCGPEEIAAIRRQRLDKGNHA
jgi:hypothetical protein